VAEVAAEDAALRVTDLAVDGKDVMRVLGTAPGRHIGVVLERLLERVLDDPSLNERDKLETLIPEVAADQSSTPPASPRRESGLVAADQSSVAAAPPTTPSPRISGERAKGEGSEIEPAPKK
jgi:hypothetical protein